MAGIAILLTLGGWLVLLPSEAKRYVFLVVALTTIILPLSVLPVLKSRRVITSYMMPTREERKIPLLLVSFFHLMGAFILQKADAPVILTLYLNGNSMILLACALINWKRKISVFLAAWGGITGMVLALTIKWMINLQLIIGILFILSGIAAFARLRLEKHTPAEVYAGYLTGFAVNFLLIFLIG
jgi:hypothetical protein